jgi:predicted amidophosphoribosyltransferase
MRHLLDLVLPTQCAGCGAPGPAACAACIAALDLPARPARPTPAPIGLPTPYAVTAYAATTRAFLLAYKEDGVVALQHPLGRALAASVEAAVHDLAGQRPCGGRPLWLVPVPSSRAARRRRGDDVVARLAARAAGVLRAAGHDVAVRSTLVHARAVADSAGLGASARAQNLSGAFRLRRGAASTVAGSPVVLVDDLITTGATLAECATSLRRTGADVVAAATVAATQRNLSIARGGLHKR